MIHVVAYQHLPMLSFTNVQFFHSTSEIKIDATNVSLNILHFTSSDYD